MCGPSNSRSPCGARAFSDGRLSCRRQGLDLVDPKNALDSGFFGICVGFVLEASITGSIIVHAMGVGSVATLSRF